MEQKPIKKKTEDTEKVYFALYFLGSSWKYLHFKKHF